MGGGMDGKKERKNEDSSWEIEYANDSAMAAVREKRKKTPSSNKIELKDR